MTRMRSAQGSQAWGDPEARHEVGHLREAPKRFRIAPRHRPCDRDEPGLSLATLGHCPCRVVRIGSAPRKMGHVAVETATGKQQMCGLLVGVAEG